MSFSLAEPGLFDVVTVIRLPEAPPAPTAESTEEPATEPAAEKLIVSDPAPVRRQLMAASNASEITAWDELQTALIAGGTVTLTQDLTAGSADKALTIPKV